MTTDPQAAHDLAVVIPAWNERENLEVLLPMLQDVLGRVGGSWEIVVVNGGSKDGTMDAVQRLGARAVRQVERGYGGALIAGFAATNASYVVTMDADLSHRPIFIEDFWKNRTQAEVLIASRYVAGGRAEMSRFRWVLSKILNNTFAVLLSIPLQDLSSGFRMYRKEALVELDLVARDFDVLEELLIKVYVRGWRIREIPFEYAPRGAGTSHARLIHFGWAYLKTLTRMLKLRYLGAPRPTILP